VATAVVEVSMAAVEVSTVAVEVATAVVTGSFISSNTNGMGMVPKLKIKSTTPP
jgi:hypothetical protein